MRHLEVCDTLRNTNLTTLLKDSALNYMLREQLQGVEVMSQFLQIVRLACQQSCKVTALPGSLMY